ncbi:DNA-binding transcriptional regulator, GntR family [Methylobacterium sp. 174MFSha1.1]|uniref:GntR family transcriptional regulator n=1 Tax=Methylobacterium sp. 174MFSha1.1 TaxID=1502749 RepID=UPI0008F1EEBD|nr:GntR family transcriptional regulator [Methylobacterium sp. 174MFSha1.1]SFU50091.1 DNA-binding transcriptional regulator, GntR family [Methylobacterium sp. 174MFSha1.1]
MSREDEAEVLSGSVYARLRTALIRAELRPHHRLKVRDLARQMGTSETPVREALVQLAHDGAIEIKPRALIRVRRLSLAEYLEIRDIRLELEPMAAERALPRVGEAEIAELAAAHDRLVAAEEGGDWPVALEANVDFHFGLYRRSGMTTLTEVLHGLWTRLGPMLSELYPGARPTYAEEHQHLAVLDALRRRDAPALRMAIRQDLIEGGRRLVRHLASLEAAPAAEPSHRSRRT